MLTLLDTPASGRETRSEHTANAWLANQPQPCDPSHCCNSRKGWHTHACLLKNSPPCDPYNSTGSKL